MKSTAYLYTQTSPLNYTLVRWTLHHHHHHHHDQHQEEDECGKCNEFHSWVHATMLEPADGGGNNVCRR